MFQDCIHESYRNSLPLHGVGVDEERSGLDNNGPSRGGSYDLSTIEGESNCFTVGICFSFVIINMGVVLCCFSIEFDLPSVS